MSKDSGKKRPLGIPPFFSYPPPKPVPIVNKEQKRFRIVITALTLLKILAFTVVALLIVGMI
jgi:hypothetical protein